MGAVWHEEVVRGAETGVPESGGRGSGAERPSAHESAGRPLVNTEGSWGQRKKIRGWVNRRGLRALVREGIKPEWEQQTLLSWRIFPMVTTS